MSPQATVETRNRRKQLLTAFCDNFSLGQYARELNSRRKLLKAQRRAAAIFDKHRPTVVLSMTDRSHDYIESGLLQEARRRGISIILPYVAHYDVEGALGYRRDSRGKILPQHTPWRRPTLYKLWMAWRLAGTLYKGVFFQDAFVLNALRKHGAMSPYPWWTGNGLSDLVCVNSQHSLDVYRRHRVPAAKLRITGDIFFDTLYAAYHEKPQLRQNIVAKYGLSPERKLIVLAMPQYLEQGYFDAKRHWAEIERIVEVLSARDADLVISLHPRMEPADYSYLPGKFPCRISDERLASILPAADLFISHYSSTVEWAILCGIPTVVVDALDFPLSIFDHLTSVRVVKPDQLAKSVDTALVQKPDFADDWQQLSRDLVFDGKTFERYRRLFNAEDAPTNFLDA
jgi:hypothetical protein